MRHLAFATLTVGLLLGLAVRPGHTDPLISRAAPPAEPVPWTATVITDDLEYPWGLDWLPDGSILVTERPGRVRVIRDGRLDPTPVSGTPDVYDAGQGGLLDIAVHPDFADNQWVYFSYAAGWRRANHTEVARARFDGTRLSDLEVVFRNADSKSGTAHFGSRLAWLPDGTMLVSIGDGGNPPVSFAGDVIRKQAQNRGTHFGSVVRINADGSVPDDNPFLNDPDARRELWSYGHRNIQGLARDPVTGVLWATEHGARRGDELNRLDAGANFGWPAATFSRNYGLGTQISPHTSLPNMVDPVVVWMGGYAPSGLAVYRGSVFPAWDGDLFAGGLVSARISRIDLDAAGHVQAEYALDMDARVRDVALGPDGHLYVLTDEDPGRLLRLDPASPAKS